MSFKSQATRRVLVAVLTAATVVAVAAIVAQARTDPGDLDCEGWSAVGSVFAGPGSTSRSSTAIGAAEAAARGMLTAGGPLDADAELVEISNVDASDAGSARVAARVDGRTVLVLELSEEADGSWDVESYRAC